jgi:hypothetical protein
MSYLGADDQAIPVGHPAAQQVQAPTISQTEGAAFSHQADIGAGAKPVRIMATNNGMEERARTGPAIHSTGPGLAARATNVMVRSGNQDGKQTQTPEGFIWGLQGVGDQPVEPAGLPKWAKLAMAAGVGLLLWKMLPRHG